MENIRLVDTSLKIVFEEGTSDNETFRREFMSLLMLHDDPLSVWLKSDKIRKESEDTDKILLTLIAELHRKVDILSLRLTTEGPLYLPLRYQGSLNAIGYGYIGFDSEVLEEGRCYYGRIDMPTFPRRQIALFFEALSSKIAKITLMHEDDKKDWSAYMAACERVMIRQMKGKESEY